MIPARGQGLGAIAALALVVMLVWLWLGWEAVAANDPSSWFIVLVAVIGGLGAALVFAWAIRRQASREPALIIDSTSLFDNISLVRAGRLRWNELDRIWIAGPSRMAVLCLLPNNLSEYLARQEDFRRIGMRLVSAAFGAPIVIPIATVGIAREDLWLRLNKVAGPACVQSRPSEDE